MLYFASINNNHRICYKSINIDIGMYFLGKNNFLRHNCVFVIHSKKTFIIFNLYQMHELKP